MGAQQSSGRDADAQGGDAVKKCYYEVLGVERSSTDDEYASSPLRYKDSQLIFYPQNQEGLQKEGSRASS
jgi:DnaJ family protein A protein 5